MLTTSNSCSSPSAATQSSLCPAPQGVVCPLTHVPLCEVRCRDPAVLGSGAQCAAIGLEMTGWEGWKEGEGTRQRTWEAHAQGQQGGTDWEWGQAGRRGQGESLGQVSQSNNRQKHWDANVRGMQGGFCLHQMFAARSTHRDGATEPSHKHASLLSLASLLWLLFPRGCPSFPGRLTPETS